MGDGNVLKKAEKEIKRVGRRTEDAVRSAGKAMDVSLIEAIKDPDKISAAIGGGEQVISSKKAQEEIAEEAGLSQEVAVPDPTLPEQEKQNEQERKIRQYFTTGGASGQKVAGVSGRQRLFGN
jgi:hypothetical protein